MVKLTVEVEERPDRTVTRRFHFTADTLDECVRGWKAAGSPGKVPEVETIEHLQVFETRDAPSTVSK